MEMQHFDDIYNMWYRDRDDFSPQKDRFQKRIAAVYPILEDLARERESITYGNLAERVDTDRRRYLSLVLGAITRMEHQEGNPPLSVLVVQSDSQTPSDGFFDLMQNLGIQTKHNSTTDEELFEEIRSDVYDFWASE